MQPEPRVSGLKKEREKILPDMPKEQRATATGIWAIIESFSIKIGNQEKPTETD
jgi:hypothetical protein